jgi:acyl-CoA thioester hydrolase
MSIVELGPLLPSTSVQVEARYYEIDANGHVTHGAYLNWAEHARFEYLRESGVNIRDLTAAGFGPVILEMTLKFGREIRVGESVTVTVEIARWEGTTFEVRHNFTPAGHERPAASCTVVMGLLDHETRRLRPTPLLDLAKVARAGSNA